MPIILLKHIQHYLYMLTGVPVSQSTTAISNCVYVNNNTSTETGCINCAITNDFDGTCVAIAHLKTSLLVNSSHGLMDINVNFLSRSLDGSFCNGCIEVPVNDYVIAVFSYQEQVGIIGSHAIVSQPRLPDYTSSGNVSLDINFLFTRNPCMGL